jgi:hypothetical protein
MWGGSSSGCDHQSKKAILGANLESQGNPGKCTDEALPDCYKNKILTCDFLDPNTVILQLRAWLVKSKFTEAPFPSLFL